MLREPVAWAAAQLVLPMSRSVARTMYWKVEDQIGTLGGKASYRLTLD